MQFWAAFWQIKTKMPRVPSIAKQAAGAIRWIDSCCDVLNKQIVHSIFGDKFPNRLKMHNLLNSQ